MQRIFGVDVSPGGSPLLAPSGPSDSIRSLQSSPRSAFTAVASLQVCMRRNKGVKFLESDAHKAARACPCRCCCGSTRVCHELPC